jgi:hypothetical protein
MFIGTRFIPNLRIITNIIAQINLVLIYPNFNPKEYIL